MIKSPEVDKRKNDIHGRKKNKKVKASIQDRQPAALCKGAFFVPFRWEGEDAYGGIKADTYLCQSLTPKTEKKRCRKKEE